MSLDWSPARPPSKKELKGRYVRLEPLTVEKHTSALWEQLNSDPGMWTYLPYGPFESFEEFKKWQATIAEGTEPVFYAIVNNNNEILGQIALMRFFPEHGSVEIGHVSFGSRLQKSVEATEVFYLLLKEAFALGNRRVEWKCDSLNERSQRAAQRLGFQFEGKFRQHLVVKGKNRDTCWFSMLDSEWPQVSKAFQQWLDPSNFDDKGNQRTPLKTRL